MSKRTSAKITLGMLKGNRYLSCVHCFFFRFFLHFLMLCLLDCNNVLLGKPVTTSVPSIAIRFNANAEEIEELYGGSDEEQQQQQQQQTVGESNNSSPLKGYLPKLIKRSASIDTSPAGSGNQESPPSSDPWRFFTDIKVIELFLDKTE